MRNLAVNSTDNRKIPRYVQNEGGFRTGMAATWGKLGCSENYARRKMTKTQILEEFAQLSVEQQIEVLAAATQILEKQFRAPATQIKQSSSHTQLAEAARQLVADYEDDGELTAFTALDAEEFNVSR